MKQIHYLASPIGGRGRASVAAITVQRVIEESGYQAINITGPTAEASREAAKQAVAEGAQRLVSVGGDGTLHIALQGVAGSDAVLGIVPAGTGNDYARTFGLLDLSVTDATLKALGPSRPVAAITTDRRRWVMFNVTGGFSVDVNKRADRMRFPRGRHRYTLSTLLMVPRLRLRDLVLTVDGERHAYRSALFAAACAPTFGGGMAVCPDAHPSNGLLDITVAGELSPCGLLSLLPKVFDGSHVNHPEVFMLRGRHVQIEGDSIELLGDGESLGTTPLTLEIVPGAVQLAA